MDIFYKILQVKDYLKEEKLSASQKCAAMRRGG
jgi:hypothetical protein